MSRQILRDFVFPEVLVCVNSRNSPDIGPIITARSFEKFRGEVTLFDGLEVEGQRDEVTGGVAYTRGALVLVTTLLWTCGAWRCRRRAVLVILRSSPGPTRRGMTSRLGVVNGSASLTPPWLFWNALGARKRQESGDGVLPLGYQGCLPLRSPVWSIRSSSGLSDG